jgi:type I restriction enzyme S subunit
MKRIPLAVAPAPEQVRIVDEIEKQFSRLDAAIAALKRVQANLKRYRASVLKAACEGHLVPTEAELARKEGREYEPADKLLERILRERRARWEADTLAKMVASGQPSKDDRWKQKYKEPLVPDLNQLPSLPEGWCWTVADQLCSQVTDGEHIQPPYTALGRPLLTAKHVQDGYVDFKEFGLIAEEDFAKARARCSPRKDDVLIVSVGATTGRAGIVRDEDPFAIVRSVLLLRPLINSTYLLSWVQSPLCQDWIGYASGSTAQAHFYIGDARRMPVALPPEEEQKRIVTKRDEMLTAMESLVYSI